MAVESIQKPRAMKQEPMEDTDCVTGVAGVRLRDDTPTSGTHKTSKAQRLTNGHVYDQPVCETDEIAKEITNVYTHISKNEYKGSAGGRSQMGEAFRCECTYEEGKDMRYQACGVDSGCMNRDILVECPLDDCPAGRHCQNRNMQRRRYPQIQVFQTEKKGFGLRALEAIWASTLVIEYCGEVITKAMFQKRVREYEEEGAKHFYFMQLKSNETIDAYRKGNHARFMNHSCDPNCKLEKWVVGPQMRLGIFAQRDIREGEELTFDYQFQRYGDEAQPCYCGSQNCKGVIGGDQPKMKLVGHEGFEESSGDEVTEESVRVKRKPKEDGDYMEEYNGMQDQNEVVQVARSFMTADKAESVLRLLRRVERTETASLLKRFLLSNGMNLLKNSLTTYIEHSVIVLTILHILKKLPLQSRTPIEKIEADVKPLAEHPEADISDLAKELLESWATLPVTYKIPRRPKAEPGTSERTASADPATPGSPKRSFDAMNGDASSAHDAIKRPRSEEDLRTRRYGSEGPTGWDRRSSVSSDIGYRRYDASRFRPDPQPRDYVRPAHPDPYRNEEKPPWRPHEPHRSSPLAYPARGPEDPWGRPAPAPGHWGPPRHEPLSSSRMYHSPHPPRFPEHPRDVPRPFEPPLPPDWTTVPSPDGSGRFYYWNKRTDKTQWERPEEPIAQPPPPPSNGASVSMPSPSAHYSLERNDSTPLKHEPPKDTWMEDTRTPPYEITEKFHRYEPAKGSPHRESSKRSSRRQQEERPSKHRKRTEESVTERDEAYIEKHLKSAVAPIVVGILKKNMDVLEKSEKNFHAIAKEITKQIARKELPKHAKANGFKGLSESAKERVQRFVDKYLKRYIEGGKELLEQGRSNGSRGSPPSSSPYLQ
ncbi:histone methyltransferase set2 [Rhizophlyctis rosea]|uniref:[histone H3]-lysine(36) N-trimethyltransferase n=1 Tax=Rhizophlyctis rosea TaxID=64517 RepID=A0AAD5SAR4_9FUNG|nr:histone methyltransferase set2 [Rhizophlyctis rosea]